MSFILAVAGGSCSGKTTLSRHLQHRMGAENCLLIRQDDYYHDIRTRDASKGLPNFDVPEALDFDQLAADLKALKTGEAVSLPNYDFTTHQRRHPSEPVKPRPYIIVEGILLLNADQLRPILDYSLFMKCSTELRFTRRLARDIAERGRTKESVHTQFYKDVEPAHQTYVAPSASYADKIVPQQEYMTNLTGLVEGVLKILPPIDAPAKIAQTD